MTKSLERRLEELEMKAAARRPPKVIRVVWIDEVTGEGTYPDGGGPDGPKAEPNSN
jgi:hypothetical protein